MDKAEFRQRAMIAAMQGMLSNPSEYSTPYSEIVRRAIMIADVLIDANTIEESEAE